MGKDIRFNRERMLVASNYYSQEGITPETAQIRVEMPLQTGIGSYNFDIKKAVARATEKLIKTNDLFIARAIGMALMIEEDAAPSKAPLLSYPLLDGLHLPTGIEGFTNANAYALYNGALSIKTDQNVIYSALPTSNFLCIPETQPHGLLTSLDAVVSAGVQPQFRMDQVLHELPEMLIFAGNHNHVIKLDAPVNTGATMAGPAGYTAYVVLIVEGYLYAQGAQDRFKKEANPLKDVI